MTVTTNIEIDLVTRGISPRIHAVQNDANTRAVEITLTSNWEAWKVPAGVTAAVAYRKPDGTRGLYDTLPDGSSAVSISGNVVTAVLAPQVLTVAGEISAAVILNDKDLNQLATFPFVILASPNPAAGAASEDYYAYSTMEDVSNAVEAWLAATEAEKQVFLSETKAEAEAAIQTTIKQMEAATKDAPGVVGQAQGTQICLLDASDRFVQGISIYGKTVQMGKPTPEAPEPMYTAGLGGIKTLYDFYYRGNSAYSNIVSDMNSEYYAGTRNNKYVGTNMRDDQIHRRSANESARISSVRPGDWVAFKVRSPGAGDYVLSMEHPVSTYGASEVNVYILPADTANIPSALASSAAVGILNFEQGSSVNTTSGSTAYVSSLIGSCTLGPAREYIVVFQTVKPSTKRSSSYYMHLAELFFKEDERQGIKVYISDNTETGVQVLQVPTLNGLPGIPVASGGNYTDSNGQQWYCDEIDLARGVYIQRVNKYICTGEENWKVAQYQYDGTGCTRFDANVNTYPGAGIYDILSSHCQYAGVGKVDIACGMNMWVNSATMLQARIMMPFATVNDLKAWLVEQSAAGTPVTILYVMAEPVESKLDEETLAAYAALRTYYPVTEIYNDANTDMFCIYIVDTKTYIDKKFAELSAAIVNNT